MPLTVGEQFAGFQILRLLGSGGMGEVYLAQHPRLPRRDALKVLPAAISGNPEFRERFKREAIIAATLFHPHVVGIHDRGEYNGQLWISMDYIDGIDSGRLLSERFPRGLPPREVVDIVSAVADALDYAHDNGLLHRDVKPTNILLTQPMSGQQRIFLTDFGISRWMADTNGLTQTNTGLGTVYYAAPEQLTGEPMDGRTDQYALAVTAYHLLTGCLPFEHPNPAVVVGKKLNTPPPSMAGTTLGALDPILHTALAKDPNHRFLRCRDFADALALQIGRSDSETTPIAANPTATALPRTAALPVPPPANPPAAVLMSAPSSQWPLVVGVVAVALIVAGLILGLRHWPSGQLAQSATGLSTPAMSGPSTAVSSTSSAAGITFGSMRDFINGYYGELPAHTREAWTKLDVGYQQRAGGLQQYSTFWSTMHSVSVMSVSPRDSTSVVAHLQYVAGNGHVLNEDRWFRIVGVNGALLIEDSEIVG